MAVMEKERTRQLTAEQIRRILSVAALGRNLNGNVQPILVGRSPKCHACGDFYPAARLTADVTDPHLCCACKSVVENHQPRRNTRGYHGHMARTPSGRDDTRSGRNTRF